jgi:hypothetical protein
MISGNVLVLLQNRTEHNVYRCEIHMQRIVTKTTHEIQNKETVKCNQTTYIHVTTFSGTF